MNAETKDRLKLYLKKYRWIIAIYILAMVVFIFGDRSTFEMYKLSPDRHSPGIITSTADKTVYPLKITDFTGREITVAKAPERIVSLASGSTEILFNLNASSRIVGVSTADDFAAEVKSLPQLGNSNVPGLEDIVSAKPDLIFAASATAQEQIAALEKAGLTVVMLEARNISEISDAIIKTGQITDTQKQSRDAVTAMQKKMAELAAKVKELPKVKTFYLDDINENQAAGRGTIIDELVALAGGENVAADAKGMVKYSASEISEKNPAVLVMSPQALPIEEIAKMPGYRDTDAVKSGKVYVVSNAAIISRPSYRIVLGLEEFARFLHPEAFKQ